MGDAFLVTGTDTGVGKTYAGSLLLQGFLEAGYDAFPLKPVESGCAPFRGGESDYSDGRTYLNLLGDSRVSLEDICFYTFEEPLSPNIAARMSGKVPEAGEIRRRVGKLLLEKEIILAEGAGGILVEIIDGYTFMDLARDLSMKVIIVVPNRLGVLNHIALNVQFLKGQKVKVAGILLNAVDKDPGYAASYNPSEIRRVYGDLFLGQISHGQRSLPDDIIPKLMG